MTRSYASVIAAISLIVGCAPADAQQQRQPQPQQRQPQTQPPASTQPVAPPTATSRTEILTFDSWMVTCREGREPNTKRVCTAELQIQQTNNNVSSVVFSWIVGLNNAGGLISIFRFPTGVLITPGLELKLAGKEARKAPYTACDPRVCEAALVMDDAFIRDAASDQNAEATIYASDGRGVKFTIVNKGFQQALAILRR